MTDQRYFAILAAMRTGSNLLEKTLEMLGDTDCYGEAFNPAFISRPGTCAVLGHTVASRDADPMGFLERMISARPDRIAGFRIFPHHNRSVMRQVLADPRCTRILLTRDPLDSWISLQIAWKTGQWMLRDPGRRRTAKIRFDTADYEEFALQRHRDLDWLKVRLAKHGMRAIRIDYRALSDRNCLQEIVRAIGSNGTVPAEPPIVRQNPVALADKVENHAEMCAYLCLEPEQNRSSAQPKAPLAIWPEGFPVGYVPILGIGFAPAIALMHRIEVCRFERENLPLPSLMARATDGTLYAPAPDGIAAFSLVCHPLARAHAAFVSDCFGRRWRTSDLRRDLARLHGPMPTRRSLAHQSEPYPTERYRAHFSAFLDCVADATKGVGPHPLIDAWVPQSTFLDQHTPGRGKLEIFRLEEFAKAAYWLTEQAGCPPLPPGQIAGIQTTGVPSRPSIADIETPEILDKVRKLYAADFDRFGYAGYSTGNSGPSNGAPSA